MVDVLKLEMPKTALQKVVIILICCVNLYTFIFICANQESEVFEPTNHTRHHYTNELTVKRNKHKFSPN